jgi:hypothetical protein
MVKVEVDDQSSENHTNNRNTLSYYSITSQT